MRCPNCGAELSSGASFCSHCGTRLQAASAAASSQVTTPAQGQGDVTPPSVPGAVPASGAAARQPAGPATTQAAQPAQEGVTQQVPTAATQAVQADATQPTAADATRPVSAPSATQAAPGVAPASQPGAAPRYDPSSDASQNPYAQTMYDPAAAAAQASQRQPLSEKEARNQARDEVRRTRDAYRNARKAAGMSNGPKVAAVIIAAIIIAAGGATASYAYMNQQAQGQQQRVDELQKQVDELTAAQTAAATKAQSAPATSAATKAAPAATTSVAVSGGAAATGYSAFSDYVGTWTGEMTETVSPRAVGTNHRCYGAKGNPIVIDVKSIDPSGQMTLSAKVLFHGHDPESLKGDVASSEGDKYLSFDNLTSTFDAEDGFEVNIEPDSATKIVIKAKPTTSGTGGSNAFEVEAESYGTTDGTVGVVDTYTVTKS